MNPVIFLGIRWYGVMITLSVVWLIWWMVWQIKKGTKISTDTVFTAAIVGIPSGIVFSRLLHVVDNTVIAKLHPDLAQSGRVIDYASNPGLIIGGSGLTIYGAVLGAALGIWIYSKFSKIKFGYFLDMAAPGIVIAQAIGRIGCTINGCCYGVTSTSWGIFYSNPNSLAPLGTLTQPATVYEMAFLLLLFPVLLKLRGRLQPDGSLFLVYLALYSLGRFNIDFMRNGDPFLFNLHQAQIVSLIVIAIAISFLSVRTKWIKQETEGTIPETEALPQEKP